MPWIDITDPESGNVIGYYDTVENFAVPLDNITQDAVDTQAGIMLATPGVLDSITGFGIDKPTTIDWAGLLPPADPIAAGLNPNNIVKTAAGGMYKYVATRNAAGVVSYTAQPYTATASIMGMSPTMLAILAGMAILALAPLKR